MSHLSSATTNSAIDHRSDVISRITHLITAAFDGHPHRRSALITVGFVFSTVVFLWQVYSTNGPIDMIIYREGAQAFRDGASLYDHPFPAYDLELPFIYPPFAALLLVPFSMMSQAAAGYVMVGFSGLLMLVCVWFLSRTLMSTKINALMLTSWVWGLCLLSEPVRHNASFGQINMWLLALVFLDIVPRHRRIPQGWLIGVAAAIKLTPLAMLFVFVLKKDWRAIIMAIIGALGATFIGAIHNTKETWDFYTRAIFVMNDSSKIGVNIAYVSNQSIKGVLTRLWPSNDAANAAATTISVLWFVLVLVVVAVFFTVILALVRQDLFLEAACANSALMLLISPISWSHHWVWLPLWLVIVATYAWRFRHVGVLVFTAIISFFTLTLPPHWWLGDPTGDQDFQQTVFMKLFMDDYFFWTFIILILLMSTKRTLGAVHSQ